MAKKAAIGGAPNSGKSYSRRTIRDGENVFLLQPSVKAAHLFTGPPDKRVAIGDFELQTKKGNLQETINGLFQTEKITAPTPHHLVHYFNETLPPGSIKKEQLMGNIQLVKDVANIPHWLKFINNHLPWVHTVLISDFTHFISEIIARPAFINRKAGGEAYQRYLEMAADALCNFILDIDNYRSDLIVVMEYHAQFDEQEHNWQLYTPGGKMLTEKFKPETYYDVFPFTDVMLKEDEEGNVIDKKYSFITERTAKYPLARTMNLFDTTRIDNDLQLVLDRMRKYLGMELK
jgi:hypothetical protein